MPIKRYRTKRGQVLVFFITVMILGLLLASGLLALHNHGYRNAKKTNNGSEAAYLAEAGIDKGFLAFKNNSSYTGENLTLGNGSVSVTIQNGATGSEKILASSATVNGLTRRLRAKLTTQASGGVAIAFRYGVQAGSSGFNLGNNSQITGNAYSNGNITGGNGSTITGDAFAVGSITGVTVTGQKKTGQPAQALPTFDSAFWKAKAQAGGTINGNYTPTDHSTIGPIYIAGNLSFSANVHVTIAGPVYVNGSVTFGNSATLGVAESLGTTGTMIASEQPIDLGNTLTVSSNSSGADLLLATISTSSTALTIGNSATSINGPLYALNGTISIGNNAHAVAFAAKGVTLGNGTIIIYDQGLANESYATGPGGTWILQKGSLQEY